MSLNNSQVLNSLNSSLSLKPLSTLSLNDAGNNILVDSPEEWYSIDEYCNHHSMDALKFDGKFYFAEFKDQRVPNINGHPTDKKEIAELLFKSFESINQICEILQLKPQDIGQFFAFEKTFIFVFSSSKSATSLNDFTTLKAYISERFGNIFQKVEIMDEILFMKLFNL